MYESISSRFIELYKTMHPDDEGNFNATLKQDSVKLKIDVDFYGKGMFPPTAYHSEGHQDSMGIALFFALMEKLASDDACLEVLDDIVMSIDIEHRKNFCKMLKTFYPDLQFIITTHDKVWAKNLVNENVVEKKNSIEFLSWNVDEGPCTIAGQDVWTTCRTKAETNLNEASAFLRREMECFFENVCDKLKARVPYNNRHKWDYGQYKYAAVSALQGYYKNAKKQAGKYNRTAKCAEVELRQSELTKYSAAADSDGWVINVLVHHNLDYEISKVDFLDAVTAMEKLCTCFECPECHNAIKVLYEGFTPSMLKCNCGTIDFHLI